jgi:hypothetical protein
MELKGGGEGKFGLLNTWRPMKDEEFNGWNTHKWIIRTLSRNLISLLVWKYEIVPNFALNPMFKNFKHFQEIYNL